ncbi:hypothetical protein J2W49_001647 [Hydrogenophaga palleronii]|uniref:Uncharacterized protein n=1 Tax=Hydrogenophaga palleronii TaxID=65655 RepID=A0ABU1WKY3_9BURK|nr:hypothetical protein [Hydrogenophaga palleronii]
MGYVTQETGQLDQIQLNQVSVMQAPYLYNTHFTDLAAVIAGLVGKPSVLHTSS